jgi:hypothetical protein
MELLANIRRLFSRQPREKPFDVESLQQGWRKQFEDDAFLSKECIEGHHADCDREIYFGMGAFLDMQCGCECHKEQ